MQEKFYRDILKDPEYIDGFVHQVTGDMLEQSEFWADDSEEFLEKFQACARTKTGKDFILFLVGHEKMVTYLGTVAEEIGITEPADEEDEL